MSEFSIETAFDQVEHPQGQVKVYFKEDPAVVAVDLDTLWEGLHDGLEVVWMGSEYWRQDEDLVYALGCPPESLAEVSEALAGAGYWVLMTPVRSIVFDANETLALRAVNLNRLG